MEWVESTLGEICDIGGGEIKTGPFGSQLHQSDYENDGTPVVMPKDIIDGRVIEDSIARVNGGHVERLAQHQLSEGDIVYGRRGDIGRQALARKENIGWLCGTGCLRVTVGDRSPASSRFLHLYLKQPDVIKWISNQAIGATMPNLNTTILRSVPVRYPEKFQYQDELADKVITYDKLIENNNRRISILEDMAQSLYREWFVKFRFPGHEAIEFKDSPLGKIPDGWEVSKFGELVVFLRDSVGKGPVEENTPYMGLEHFPRKSLALSEWEEVNKIGSSKLRFKKGDVLFGKIRPYFHKVGVAQTDGLCSSDTFVWREAKPKYAALIASVAFSEDFVSHSVQTSQGTKMPRANWDVLKEYDVVIPSKVVLEQFNVLVDAAIEEIGVLSAKNRNLKVQRDMLLPKLISGKITIKG